MRRRPVEHPTRPVWPQTRLGQRERIAARALGGVGMSAVGARVELRELSVGDLNAIETIERRSYPTPWSRSMFAGELAKPSSLCVGAFEPETDELHGYMIVSRYVDAWHVMNIAVSPDHRRQGIARTLLEHLFVVTAGHGHRGYTLEVRVSNAEAIRLYESVGFKARGIRRGYYTDNREDALIMWKDPLPVRSANG